MRMGYQAFLESVERFCLTWAVSGGISGVVELLNDSCYVVFLGYLSLL